MIQYWQSLQDRERLMVIIAALVICSYLFYLLIYSSLYQAEHSNSLQLKEKKETLLWMQTVRTNQLQKKTPQQITSIKLLALISNQLHDVSLASFPYQLQQSNIGDIQLSFDKVAFNPFIFWLWTLTNNYSIEIKRFVAEQTETQGLTKLSLTIGPVK